MYFLAMKGHLNKNKGETNDQGIEQILLAHAYSCVNVATWKFSLIVSQHQQTNHCHLNNSFLVYRLSSIYFTVLLRERKR
jgi:hypothetical protein